MCAPICDFWALYGIGPRIAEHTINAIPMHPFPSYEDIRLKAPSAGSGASGALAADRPRPYCLAAKASRMAPGDMGSVVRRTPIAR